MEQKCKIYYISSYSKNDPDEQINRELKNGWRVIHMATTHGKNIINPSIIIIYERSINRRQQPIAKPFSS